VQFFYFLFIIVGFLSGFRENKANAFSVQRAVATESCEEASVSERKLHDQFYSYYFETDEESNKKEDKHAPAVFTTVAGFQATAVNHTPQLFIAFTAPYFARAAIDDHSAPLFILYRNIRV